MGVVLSGWFLWYIFCSETAGRMPCIFSSRIVLKFESCERICWCELCGFFSSAPKSPCLAHIFVGFQNSKNECDKEISYPSLRMYST